MSNTGFNRTKLIKYLIWTFGLAYAVQIGVWLLYQSGNALMIGQIVMAAMMFVPMLGVLLSGVKLSGMGWRPGFKKNIRYILIAWLLPAVLTAAGAALYFVIFPGQFDTGGSYAEAMAPGTLAQLEAQGLTYPVAVLISAAASVTYAPLINTAVALGEEIGWRGFMYPQLKARFGRTAGRLIGGLIWGAWHWPLIWLIGYEYGERYFGFPVVGMLLFCVFTVTMGILCDWLYEKSGSIWLPSLCHGAVNAAANIPMLLCATGTDEYRLLGPVPNGLIAGLPIFAIGAALLIIDSKKSTKE